MTLNKARKDSTPSTGFEHHTENPAAYPLPGTKCVHIFRMTIQHKDLQFITELVSQASWQQFSFRIVSHQLSSQLTNSSLKCHFMYLLQCMYFCFLHGVEGSRNRKATKNISVLFTSFLKSKVIKISHKWQNQNILHSVQKTLLTCWQSVITSKSSYNSLEKLQLQNLIYKWRHVDLKLQENI